MAPGYHSRPSLPAFFYDDSARLSLENCTEAQKENESLVPQTAALPACHLCGKLHRTCIADIGWCLTFVSAPPIGYDPRAEDLRKHVPTAQHRHTGTCNRPVNITPLASLVRVDSKPIGSGFDSRPATTTHCAWLQQRFVKGRAQSCWSGLLQLKARQRTIQSLKRACSRPRPRQVPPYPMYVAKPS